MNGSREEKIRLLEDLQRGKITREDLLPKQLKIAIFRTEQGTTGTRITMNGKDVSQEEFQAEFERQKGRIMKIHVVYA